MPLLTSLSFDLANDPIIDLTTSGQVWNLSEGRVITWGLSDANNTNNAAWVDPDYMVGRFDQAFETIEQYINVDFQYSGRFSDGASAISAEVDLVMFPQLFDAQTGAWAYAYYPGAPDQPGLPAVAGDAYFNVDAPFLQGTSWQMGSAGFMVILHELGHSLGLKHLHDNGGTGRPTSEQIGLPAAFDKDWSSIMSYRDDRQSSTEIWDPASPMLLDVIALHYLYGPNETHNAGDTEFKLVGYDDYYTYWDPNGEDLVDASQAQEGWNVYLPDTQFTELVEAIAGLAVPVSQDTEELEDFSPTDLVWLMGDIENATGSGFADGLYGNHLVNRLSGGGGDDTMSGVGGDDILDGQGGTDTAQYQGVQANYTLTLGPNSMTIEDRFADGDGTDSLRNIEFLEFEGEAQNGLFDLRQYGGPAGLSGVELETFIELYIAYFNRAPDAVGLNFWGTAFANGITLEEIATYFIDQPETRATYAPDLSNTNFATEVYGNVLGRIPDQDGFDFWVNALDSGGVGRDQFILGVLGGAKAPPPADATQDFIDQQQADREYLATKTDIGALYAVHSGMSNVSNAVEAMSLYDGTQSGLNAAVTAIDTYFTSALDAENGEFLMPIVGVLDNPFEAVA